MQGVSAEFDEAEATLESVDGELQSHLEQVKSQLKSNRSICYVSLNKDSHVLEIPEVQSCNKNAYAGHGILEAHPVDPF